MNIPTFQLTDDPRVQASALLVRLRSVFESVVHRVAHSCADGSALNAELLDQHQWASYQIALASADLLGAESLARSDGLSDLERRLAMAFVADAISGVLERLGSIFADTAMDAGELHVLVCSPELAALRRSATGASALARTGKDVMDCAVALDGVSLEEDVVMARDAFDRFAADVVAPLAESIHRNDLTVPETLLQPLREMGVFGLSIPQEFGGSATGHQSDAMMMIAVTEALSEKSLAAAGSLITRPEILARALLAGGVPRRRNGIGCQGSHPAIPCVPLPSRNLTMARMSPA